MVSSTSSLSSSAEEKHEESAPHYGSIPVTDDHSDTTTSGANECRYPESGIIPKKKVIMCAVATAIVAMLSFMASMMVVHKSFGLRSSGIIMVTPSLLEEQSPDSSMRGSTTSGLKKKHHSSPKRESFFYDDHLDELELFYHDMKVDHIHDPNNNSTYSHRYYKKSKHFQGPGHPILVILGGEDALDPPLLFPFVHEAMAQKFGALTLSPEHRFYGKSQPKGRHFTVSDMELYLTPDQAVLDFIQLIQYAREELGCSPDRSSSEYCPVITFGGSYPGFLSFIMRFLYNDYVDIAYASSAPLELYSQKVDSNAYYDKVSESAALVDPQCPQAIRQTLDSIVQELRDDYDPDEVRAAAKHIGICASKHRKDGSLPIYMKDVETLISEAIIYLVPGIFADYNMVFYPPGPDTIMGVACRNFMNETNTPAEKMKTFYIHRAANEYDVYDASCFDLHLELPTGPEARVMGADWSGSGGGETGTVWEYQCCHDLVIKTGYSNASMFVPREWTYAWHKQRCNARFPGVPIEPSHLVNEWGFDDLTHADKIIFTNGMNDGWSTSSITEIPPGNVGTLKIINFPNGAHHSELAGRYPDPRATDDIKEGLETVLATLEEWLNEI